tara:strand:+ start:23995 stop:26103 length:2109 start_codon:yes stop_codon:yes gene_type:complete
MKTFSPNSQTTEYLNKDFVLSEIDCHQAFNRYLRPYHSFNQLEPGKHISNPFLNEVQKTPSFNIYKTDNNEWRYKDFATGDDGNLIDLVMKLHNKDFKSALKTIADDFHIYENITTNNNFEIEVFDWNVEALSYWKTFHIEQPHLDAYGVKPVKRFSRSNANSNLIEVLPLQDNPCFAYYISNSCYKLYSPLSTKFRFSWLGKKPIDYVFGFDQLPEQGNRVFITGGEKDVISLFAHHEHAVCLNSETANPSTALIQSLKQRFDEVIVLYDLDKTGLKQSQKICDTHKLHRMLLPQKLKEQDGKDVSDFFKLDFNLNDNETIIQPPKLDIPKGQYINLLLKTQEELTKSKAQNITKPSPLLTFNENGIIFPRTINIIQGKAGVHKSRLAETFCSAFIKHPNCNIDHLNFNANSLLKSSVCYVDTERNLSEQFPFALQQILTKAGYKKDETPENFEYISLLQVPRMDRFKALTEYLEYIRKKFSSHVIIILDVVTDCIKDFNRSEDSMQLIDLMNESINKYNVTFIGLIHENPGSTDKARGHLGTELMNKSSTVIQVGFEKGPNNQPSDIIALNFLKARSTKKFDSIHFRFCQEAKGLVLAESYELEGLKTSRQTKAEIPEVMAFLSKELTSSFSTKDLTSLISDEFFCSTKIAGERLKHLIDGQHYIENSIGQKCTLTKKSKGKEMMYNLTPLPDEHQLKAC